MAVNHLSPNSFCRLERSRWSDHSMDDLVHRLHIVRSAIIWVAMKNFALEIAETARVIRREANKRAAVLGSTKAQWRVLARLRNSGDGVRQIELAEALDVEPIT